MGSTLFSRSVQLFERLRFGGEGLPQDPDRRRRFRASMILSAALAAGLFSSQSLQRGAVSRYENEHAPSAELIARMAALRGFKPIDEALASHLPPLERTNHAWWELPARRLWWVGRNGTLSIFALHGDERAPKGTPSFESLGEGWQALLPAIDAMAGPDHGPARPAQPRSNTVRRHPREWQF